MFIFFFNLLKEYYHFKIYNSTYNILVYTLFSEAKMLKENNRESNDRWTDQFWHHTVSFGFTHLSIIPNYT